MFGLHTAPDVEHRTTFERLGVNLLKERTSKTGALVARNQRGVIMLQPIPHTSQISRQLLQWETWACPVQ